MDCLQFREAIEKIEELNPQGEELVQLQMHVSGETVCVDCRQFALSTLFKFQDDFGEDYLGFKRLNELIYYPPGLADQPIEQQRAFVADKLSELTPAQRKIVYKEVLKEDFRDGDEHLPWHDIVKRFVAKHT